VKHGLLVITMLGLASVAASQSSIVETKHNLSASGPGSARALSESQICIFCHTSHSAAPQAPLWNRRDTGQYFRMYWSPSVDAYTTRGAAPQPNGASKLCLSCHDGTIALGSTVAAGEIRMVGGGSRMPSRSRVSSDLSGHHPVSFRVSDALVARNNSKGDVPLRYPAEIVSDPHVTLDGEGRMQCTSCHDPHRDKYGGFLRAPSEDELCIACHS
jgi:predicted CXXCH cytochrome family protein